MSPCLANKQPSFVVLPATILGYIFQFPMSSISSLPSYATDLAENNPDLDLRTHGDPKVICTGQDILTEEEMQTVEIKWILR